VSLPADRAAALSSIPEVDWAAPYLPQDKIAPEIATLRAAEAGDEDVIVYLQLFSDVDPDEVAAELEAQGLTVTGAGRGSRFGRVVLLMSAEDVEARRAELAARNDVFWVGRRYRRVLTNDDVVWIDQSGLDGGQTTPVHDHGVVGTGQIGAVLDTGIDADACFFRDGTLGLPPTNTGGGTTVDMSQRKVIAVDFLDPSENPADPTHWDTHGHGSHVTGTLVGDDLASPIAHDPGDGMAPGAKVVHQDAGYSADDCADLPGLGCPVTDLIPIFQQAYDQGARVHSNSWNDNENAAVGNLYTDAAEDLDEFVWNHPDFLVVVGAGNDAFGGFGTMGSPGTSKSGMAIGATFNQASAIYLSDISTWGPTDDGRLKPDVLSPGASIYSCANDGNVTTNNCSTQGMTGTSMATPGAGGSALLIRQYFEDGFYPTGSANAPDGFNPTAALVKAMLINSGTPIDYAWDEGDLLPITDKFPGIQQGWGRILLDDAMYFDGDGRGLYVDDHTSGFTGPGDPPVTYLMEVLDSSEPLKVTLVWSDYPSTPASSIHLINDLDLRVDGAGGGWQGNAFLYGESFHLGDPDRLNTVEGVLVKEPAPGTYAIQVSPHAIPSGPQGYALVVTGRVDVSAGPLPVHYSHVVDDSGPNGNGDGVLDPGETAIVPVTLLNVGDADATSVVANLFAAQPDLLKVYDGTASYADMPQGAQAASQAPHFEVTLEPSASCGNWVGADMRVSGNGFVSGSAFVMDAGTYEGDRPSTDTPLSIPRQGDVYSYLDIPMSFPITDISVTVNVAFDDIGELRLVLYAPDNTLVFLHDQGSPGTSDIHTTYDTLTQAVAGSMEDFLSVDPQGTWRIRAIDYDRNHGTLEDWTLHFKSEVPFDCNPVGCGEGVPGPVGDTLMVDRSGGTDAQITWTGVGSADYNVWRSEDPQLKTAAFIGSSGGATSLIDGGVLTLPDIHYYVVRSVNACRWESD
jgi:subtilisin-like proprotein convertase family protein